jgi:hypothetical protein
MLKSVKVEHPILLMSLWIEQIDQVVLPSVDVNALIAEDELERNASYSCSTSFWICSRCQS